MRMQHQIPSIGAEKQYENKWKGDQGKTRNYRTYKSDED
jgi:hypothetical protein